MGPVTGGNLGTHATQTGLSALLVWTLLGCLGTASEPAAKPVPATKAAGTAAVPDKPGPITKESWPSFRKGPQLLGVAESKLPTNPQLLWKIEAGEMIASTAAIAGGRVYAAALSGELFCLDAANGRRLWTYRSITDPDPKAFAPGFKASPLVTADRVYIGDEDGVFHAVDRATGTGLWTFKTDAEIVSSAVMYGETVIFGSHDNSLYCLKLDGTKAWQFVTQGPVNCSPAVVGTNTFVTGCDEHLRVIDVVEGKELRDIPLNTYLIASPAVVDNLLFVGTYASEVVAVDWKTGQKQWTYRDVKRDFPYHSSAAVNDKYVILGGRDKRIHCIDRKTGQGVWMVTTRGKVDGSPVIVGDRVFVGSQDGNLYGLRISDGEELWKFTDEAGKSFSASPAVGEGKLVIGSESSQGYLYCFGAK